VVVGADRLAGSARKEEWNSMQKLLLAYDGSEQSHKALELAAEMARRFGATLTVLSVVPVRPGRSPMDPWDDTQVHTDELVEARRLLREEGIEARLVESAGNVPEVIERFAEAGSFDAVIVGSRGLGVLGRALQGSVSEHVATHANTTVVVAR
jgi:nucleotide-binding universal stress UspA family protein